MAEVIAAVVFLALVLVVASTVLRVAGNAFEALSGGVRRALERIEEEQRRAAALAQGPPPPRGVRPPPPARAAAEPGWLDLDAEPARDEMEGGAWDDEAALRDEAADTAESLLPEAVAAEAGTAPGWDAMQRDGRPEPVRPALETVDVDWRAQHAEFHRRYVDAPAAPRAALRRGLAGALHDRATLRRLSVAAEVLGPPRALRPHDL